MTMDIFEEIVRLRREGKRAALATIVHTNGSIPSYESSRMLVREDGSIAGTVGGGCVEAEVWAAAKDVIRGEAPRKMTFNLNNEASYDDAFEKLRPNASSYLVIVTRGHKDDMRVLRWAVGTQARYIGMIGSKRKVLSVYKALEKEGVPTEKFERVRAPVGLEIGALTPEEIAVSIAAELISVRRSARDLPHKGVQLAKASPTVAG